MNDTKNTIVVLFYFWVFLNYFLLLIEIKKLIIYQVFDLELIFYVLVHLDFIYQIQELFQQYPLFHLVFPFFFFFSFLGILRKLILFFKISWCTFNQMYLNLISFCAFCVIEICMRTFLMSILHVEEFLL